MKEPDERGNVLCGAKEDERGRVRHCRSKLDSDVRGHAGDVEVAVYLCNGDDCLFFSGSIGVHERIQIWLAREYTSHDPDDIPASRGGLIFGRAVQPAQFCRPDTNRRRRRLARPENPRRCLRIRWC